MTKDLWVAYTRIFFVELAYWIVSISLVFVNESILSPDVLTDDLTIFITMFQIAFSLCILITLNYLTTNYLLPKRQATNIDSESLVNLLIVNIPHRLNFSTCKMVFSLSTLYIGMLLLNNFCLKYVGVAFYFVSRSLTTVFNVTFTYFLIGEPISFGSLICCTLIVFGFILGIDQENVLGSLSVIGVLFGVTSSLFTSLFSIYTKKTLAKLDRNIWVLVLYNNINALVICSPLLIVHGDVQALISDKVISPRFWCFLSISGVMAFFISIVTNASIKYTSPLTHNISGTAKACFQTVIAVIVKQDHKSTLWWISNFTILVASAFYSRIRQLEMERKSATLPTLSTDKNHRHLHQHNHHYLSQPSDDFEKLLENQDQVDRVSQRKNSSSSGCSVASDEIILHQASNSCSVDVKSTTTTNNL